MTQRTPFATRTVIVDNGFLPPFEQDQMQCPCCGRWFYYYNGWVYGGLTQHITIWAKKEAVAFTLGELAARDMRHFEYWKANTKVVDNVPKKREWRF